MRSRFRPTLEAHHRTNSVGRGASERSIAAPWLGAGHPLAGVLRQAETVFAQLVSVTAAQAAGVVLLFGLGFGLSLAIRSGGPGRAGLSGRCSQGAQARCLPRAHRRRSRKTPVGLCGPRVAPPPQSPDSGAACRVSRRNPQGCRSAPPFASCRSPDLPHRRHPTCGARASPGSVASSRRSPVCARGRGGGVAPDIRGESALRRRRRVVAAGTRSGPLPARLTS
jgi:hypothetical protein